MQNNEKMGEKEFSLSPSPCYCMALQIAGGIGYFRKGRSDRFYFFFVGSVLTGLVFMDRGSETGPAS